MFEKIKPWSQKAPVALIIAITPLWGISSNAETDSAKPAIVKTCSLSGSVHLSGPTALHCESELFTIEAGTEIITNGHNLIIQSDGNLAFGDDKSCDSQKEPQVQILSYSEAELAMNWESALADSPYLTPAKVAGIAEPNFDPAAINPKLNTPGRSGGNGASGVNGRPGTEGKDAGKVIVRATGSIKGCLLVRNEGTNGEKGSPSGSGQDAGSGERGGGAKQSSHLDCPHPAQRGGTGGTAGTAGTPGAGGQGGDGGVISINSLALSKYFKMYSGFYNQGGDAGPAGDVASSGSPGKGGYGGPSGDYIKVFEGKVNHCDDETESRKGSTGSVPDVPQAAIAKNGADGNLAIVEDQNSLEIQRYNAEDGSVVSTIMAFPSDEDLMRNLQ